MTYIDEHDTGPDWIDDGHQARVTLGHYGFEYAIVCPHADTDLTGKPWDALPVCRRAGDEDGNPRPDRSPTDRCALGIFADEWSADELFVFGKDAPPLEVVSPFAVEYRFRGWEGDDAQVRPKQAAVEPAPVVQVPGQQQIPAEVAPSPALRGADEPDAVHFARDGEPVRCGAPGIRRTAEHVAAVTCRDCLETFQTPATVTAGSGAAS